MKQIGVIGSGSCDKRVRDLAYKVGYEIGEEAVLVCGGLGGVMKSASKGCKDAGGETVGIIPSNNKEDANKYIDFVVVTGLGEARNVLVVKSSDALIAIDGGFGTLSEISLAKKTNKSVIGLGNGFSGLMTKRGYIKKADSPESAVKSALNSI